MTAFTRTKVAVDGWRLTAFIAVSIALHGLLLSGWSRDDTVLPVTSRLMVTVTASGPTTPTTAAHPKVTTPVQRDTVRSRSVTRPQEPLNSSVNEITTIAAAAPEQAHQQQAKTSQSTMTNDTGADTGTGADTESGTDTGTATDTTSATNIATASTPVFSLGQMKERLDRQLSSNFARHFHYPYLAQRRNWQGEVRLGLRIEASGHLSHIHIVKSSGYALLDQAAVDSLKKVAALPEADHWLRGNSFDTVLPVKYRLIDS